MTRMRATLRGLNAIVPATLQAATQEKQMEMQKQATAVTTTGIAAEMLTLAVQALVSGVAAAIVAGSLVVLLTVMAA